jgi:hypothetical protein
MVFIKKEKGKSKKVIFVFTGIAKKIGIEFRVEYLELLND